MRMNLKVCWKMNSKKMKRLLYLIFASWICVSVQAQDEEIPQQDLTAKEKIQAEASHKEADLKALVLLFIIALLQAVNKKLRVLAILQL